MYCYLERMGCDCTTDRDDRRMMAISDGALVACGAVSGQPSHFPHSCSPFMSKCDSLQDTKCSIKLIS